VSPVLLVVVAPFALGLIVWAILDLEWFVLIVVLTSMLVPASLGKPGGANIAAVDIFLLVALASWLINNAVGNAPDPQFRGQPFALAAIIFAVVQWTSLIWSHNPHRTVEFSIQATELFILFPVVFRSLPRSVANIDRAMSLLLFGTGVLSIALVIVFLTSPTAHKTGTYLPGLNKNAAGCYTSIGVVIAYAFLLRHGRSRGWVIAMLLLDVLGLIATESRGAMVGAAAGIFVVNVIMKRGRLAFVVLVLVFVAMYFAVIAPGEAAKTRVSGSYSSATIRLTIWKDAIRIIGRDPILGVGAGAYYDPPTGQSDPNNVFLKTFAEVGIIGLLALGYMLYAFAAMIPPWRRTADRNTAALAAACAGSFLCGFMHDQVDVSWVRGTGSIMLAMIGLLMALDRLSSPATQAVPEVEAVGYANVPLEPVAGAV